MNQRRGKMHAAGLSDRQDVPLAKIIRFVRQAQAALEAENLDEEAARFEIFGDFLEEDVATGSAPLEFTYRSIGL